MSRPVGNAPGGIAYHRAEMVHESHEGESLWLWVAACSVNHKRLVYLDGVVDFDDPAIFAYVGAEGDNPRRACTRCYR